MWPPPDKGIQYYPYTGGRIQGKNKRGVLLPSSWHRFRKWNLPPLSPFESKFQEIRKNKIIIFPTTFTLTSKVSNNIIIKDWTSKITWQKTKWSYFSLIYFIYITHCYIHNFWKVSYAILFDVFIAVYLVSRLELTWLHESTCANQ